MKISVEISMYPLDADYGTPILRFIKRLRQNENLRVESNSLSTQIFGDYEEVMGTLQSEMKKSFEENETVSMVMKVVSIDHGKRTTDE